MRLWEPFSRPTLTPSQIQDLRLSASKMTGAPRRAFQAEMTLKYCRGAATAGRSARAASPDCSHDARLSAPHGSGRWGSATGARGPRGATALSQHHGGSVNPEGLSLAQSDHSQAAEKAPGNRCHL